MAAPVAEPPRPRTPWTWGAAILLLGTLVAGLVGGAILLWRYIDVDSLIEAAMDEAPLPVEAPLAEVALPELPATVAWTAHIYVSPRSASFFPDRDYYAALIERWESALAAVGAAVELVSGAAAIESLAAGDLLVIPAAVCLDMREREAILGHAERGHLLATWALGARDENCDWLGFEYLRDLAGAETAGTLEARPPTYLVVPHGSVVAAGLPPGTRLEIRTEPWITLRAGASNIFWSDWALNPLSAPEGGAGSGAIARTTPSGTRIAWFGYRLDVGASPADQRLLDRLAQNAALWAAGHVLAEVDPWPSGYRAAMAVTQDVEHSFTNSRRLAERFSERGLPLTFFVVTQLAREHPELAGVLADAGELGSHSVDHRQVGGRPWSAQLAAVNQARADIAAWSGRQPLGFRPPRELFDSLTLEAWRQSGGLYLAAANAARSAAPEIFGVASGRVVVLPRVVDDDYTVIVTRGQTRSDSLRAAFVGGLEKMRSLGGLSLVTLHSQLINSRRRVAAVESAARAAQEAGDVWLVGTSQIAEWWLSRSELELTVHEREDRSAILSLRNNGASAVESAWLHVYLPEDGDSFAAPELGDMILESHYGSGGLRVRLPAIEPGGFVEILLPRRPA
ncbi:MAG: polysaccharide deacetylase family protein [Gemmatimonadota bacterium]|nr:MAG: polysaccharide deacetylase family protein [Gemmatimonadota bacterium]